MFTHTTCVHKFIHTTSPSIRSRQNFGSTSPLFSRYTSEYGDCVSREQEEVMPKLYLRSDQDKETNSSTDPQAVQKTWTIRNRYGRRYAQKCIPPVVSLSNGRHLTRLRDLRTIRPKGIFNLLPSYGGELQQICHP
jgi:hypothetical protein